ncbi:MAG: magnesium transporter [Omnitrophica bacterium RBG_13_46_9]|nr:MAG: magnesium transporter [Omnitrophica bacterium RBG_13_46_9]
MQAPVKSHRKKYGMLELFLPDIRELITVKNISELKKLLNDISAVDLAEGWSRLESQEKILLFKLLSAKKQIEVFEDLKFEEQKFLVDNLGDEGIASILNEMSPDERLKLFRRISEKTSKKFFNLLKNKEAINVRALLEYKENSAGSIMTTDIVEVKKDMTAKKALLVLQETLTLGYEKDVHSVYVTDEEHRLTGVVNLQTLLKAPQDISIKDIMSSAEPIKMDADTDKAEIAKYFSKYDLLDMPVVDSAGRLLGTVTIDDVVDLMETQATKEVYEIGKMNPSEGEIISYRTATAWEVIKRRAGWLILLLMFDFLTGTVLKNFEASLSAVVALAFFIPMLLDTGGNAGAQVAITVIRGLATRDVNLGNVKRVIRLELITAFFMATLVASIAFGRAVLLQKDFFVSAVVGTTMFLVVIVAILTGLALPLLSKKIGLDPAALAGPITTSVVDIIGLIIYFRIAQIFIPILQ